MHGAESTSEREQAAVRWHRKLLRVCRATSNFFPQRHFNNFTGNHVVHEKVRKVLRPDNHLVAVGGKFGRFHREVFKVDGLDFGVGFAVNLDDGGGAGETGHKAHRALRVEFGASGYFKELIWYYIKLK